MLAPLDASLLPDGVRSRFVDGINGLSMHVLEAGFEQKGRPGLLLLHGFPELAYSWRKVMPALAAAGYHVIAPDQRGYGRTTGWTADFDDSLEPFRILNFVRDALYLVAAMGHATVDLVGHDFGSPVAAGCALVRPDVFRTVTLMSAPYGGTPTLPFDTADAPATPRGDDPVHAAMAALARPRKHYHWYYSTRPANDDLIKCSQGVHDFMRAYYHHKSADWVANKPHNLTGWTADELAKMPTYYIMDLNETMAEAVAHEMPSAQEISDCRWMSEAEMAVYAEEYGRNGFQGGLQFYRIRTGGRLAADLEVFSGRSIDVPACFIGGSSDWGVQQAPGALEAMQSTACSKFQDVHLVDGAGHWVQQEQPEETSRLLINFLKRNA
jgi:pimeloyl-ACP methyl ester carboxylesterase